MIMRLETVERDLVERLKVTSKKQRLSAVKVACELAFQKNLLGVSIVAKSLGQLRLGNKLTIEQVSDLDVFAEKLDGKCFNLQDGLDEGGV